MARINMTAVVVSAGVGAVDVFTEKMDADDLAEGKTTAKDQAGLFGSKTNIARIAMAGLGYLGQIFGFFPTYAEPLAIAATPLLVKTVAKQLQIGVPKAKAAGVPMETVFSRSPARSGVGAYQPITPKPRLI